MLSLVEFQMINKMKRNICRLEYSPNLAAGFILAKCKEEGIKTKLIKGQTRYFRDIFIIQKEYLMIHGKDEFFPIFLDPKEIINKIKNG